MTALERSSILKHEREKVKQELDGLLKELLREECLSPGVFTDDIISQTKSAQKLSIYISIRESVVRTPLKHISEDGIPTKRAVGYSAKHELIEIVYRGTLSSDKAIIQHVFVKHYEELFSYRAPNSDDFRRFFYRSSRNWQTI